MWPARLLLLRHHHVMQLVVSNIVHTRSAAVLRHVGAHQVHV
jgi:hypothetical protein